MKRRVVVTGLGVISPLGLNVEDTWDGLLAGRSGAAPIQQFDPSNLDVRFGCEVKGFDPLQWMSKKEARRFDRFLQYAVAAAAQAMRDACLGEVVPEPHRAGVVVGSGENSIRCALSSAHFLGLPGTLRPCRAPVASLIASRAAIGGLGASCCQRGQRRTSSQSTFITRPVDFVKRFGNKYER